MITDIGQIAVTVTGVPRAKAFYVETLGLKHLFDVGPNLCFVAAGSVRILLTQPQGAGAPGMNPVLYSRTDSLPDHFRSVLSRGATLEREPQLAAKLRSRALDRLRAGSRRQSCGIHGGAQVKAPIRQVLARLKTTRQESPCFL